MDNNENNVNVTNDFENQILMGETQTPNLNQAENTQPETSEVNMQPQNNLNLNQPLETNTQPKDDNIFSDMQPAAPEEPITNPQPPKKGKGSTIIVILLILIILGLGGYIAYDKFISKEKPTPTPTTKAEETNKTKPLLKDSNQEVVYSDIDEKHEGKVKRVPYINIDSKYAEKINDEIDSMVKKGLEGQVANTAYTVDYQYFVNDEIVSVKFSWETENSMTVSKIYNINQYTGYEVTNKEILNKVNINESDLNNKMVESYKAARPLESIENNKDSAVQECYQKDLDTLSNGKIKAMYINKNELYVLFDLNYIAGSGIGEAILNVTSNKLIVNPVTMQ